MGEIAEAARCVTRIACFKFKAWVGAGEIGARTGAFLALYDQYAHLLAEKPRGGRPLETPLELTGVEREKEWDTGFVVRFKVRCSHLFFFLSSGWCMLSEAARLEFDKAEGHDRLKNETDPLLERVFVYDFVDQENLGW
ncbi:hypothetical protein PMIN01_02935 [Paraphaeosphaeria minitans]|uniref:Uncharacterized protein n=1 Tax=Paraphaeosphaeria minitans TaxID=565426 RepID=A0A9P6GTK6_9PLEO|nr:hypothetical protein PMIN01_02935 [Paraphaeosphaeria minitans]